MAEKMTGTAQAVVNFLMNQISEGGAGKLWEIKEHRSQRTLTQNAYYWVLLTKLADKLRISKPEAHNRMLRSYGQPAVINRKLVYTYLPDTEETEEQILAQELYHLAPTSSVMLSSKGVPLRAYKLLRGSSDYDVDEMSALVDGLVQEATQLHIEVLTPRELEMMRDNERKHTAKRS